MALLSVWQSAGVQGELLCRELFSGVQSEDPDKVSKSLAKGADPNHRMKTVESDRSLVRSVITLLSHRNESQLDPTPLMVALDLSRLMSQTDQSTRRVSARIVTDLLDKGANPNLVGGYGTFQMPVIVHAVSANRLEVVATLLEHGADPNKEGPSGVVALEFANNVKMAQLLVTHGANIRHRNADGLSPLDAINMGPVNRELTKYLSRIGSR